MKLTTERLKKLIREEMQKIHEAIPSTVDEKGSVSYSGYNLQFFMVYDNIDKTNDVVDSLEKATERTLVGQYAVNPAGALMQQINSSANLKTQKSDPSRIGEYMKRNIVAVRIKPQNNKTAQEIADELHSNGDIYYPGEHKSSME